MQMTVKFKSGVIEDALLLSVGSDRIRVVVAGRSTTEEWLMLDGRLFDEEGRIIEVQALFAVDGVEYSQLIELYGRTAAAGGFGSSMA
jgi:hypothetical protein